MSTRRFILQANFPTDTLSAELCAELERLHARVLELRHRALYDPAPRHCGYCGERLLRRTDEPRWKFARRRFCSRSHASKARMAPAVIAPGEHNGHRCLHCHKPLTRKRYENGCLEAPKALASRRFCDRACGRRYHLERKLEVAKAKVAAPVKLPDPRPAASSYERGVMRSDLERCPEHGDFIGVFGCPTCNLHGRRAA